LDTRGIAAAATVIVNVMYSPGNSPGAITPAHQESIRADEANGTGGPAGPS